MNKETRNIESPLEYRTNEAGKRVVFGYAAKYNTESIDLGGFTESIEPGAFTNELIQRSDVVCVVNHEPGRGLLARSRNGKGSLTLRPDSVGLYFEFEVPDTELAKEVLQGIERKDITGCSFIFSLDYSDETAQSWEPATSTKLAHRKISKFSKLYDVSPVYYPAYENTEVSARALDIAKRNLSIFNYNVLNTYF